MVAFGRKCKQWCSADQGFTILEVVVALAIFSVGIMAVAGLQVSATNGDLRARLATEAATLAHDQAERLLSLEYDPDVDPPIEEFRATTFSGYSTYPTDRKIDSGRYRVDWTVEPLEDTEVRDLPDPLPAPPPYPKALKIRVRVDWNHFGDSKQYVLEFVKVADI